MLYSVLELEKQLEGERRSVEKKQMRVPENFNAMKISEDFIPSSQLSLYFYLNKSIEFDNINIKSLLITTFKNNFMIFINSIINCKKSPDRWKWNHFVLSVPLRIIRRGTLKY